MSERSSWPGIETPVMGRPQRFDKNSNSTPPRRRYRCSMPLESQIVERFNRNEASAEEVLIELYLAGVSLRSVERVAESLWGGQVTAANLGRINQNIHQQIEKWLTRPLAPEYAYVFLDALAIRCHWQGRTQNTFVLFAIAVGTDGFRTVIGAALAMSEDQFAWIGLLRQVEQRGLARIPMVCAAESPGLRNALATVYPRAAWQRCTADWCRQVGEAATNSQARAVAAMLRAIHTQKKPDATRQKAAQVTLQLQECGLHQAATVLEETLPATLTYLDFPLEHHRRIHTVNPFARIKRELHARARAIGPFPDGKSALILAAAHFRHLSENQWQSRRYLNLERGKQPA